MSANDHLIDSPVKLGTCNRCGAYVYLAHSSGIRSAADVAPAGRDAYVAAALDGRRHFDLVETAGRPSKLICRTSRSPAPTFDPGGAQIAVQGRRPVLVEHGCGGRAQNMIKFTEVEERPTATVCDTWKATGWTPPPGKCARERGRDVKSCPECEAPPFDHDTKRGTKEEALAAWDAINGGPPRHPPPHTPGRRTRHPAPGNATGSAPRCGTCRRQCAPGTYTAIQRGREWVWAEHEEGYCT